MKDLTDDDLALLLRNGDADAYTEIYHRFKGALYLHAYKKLGDFEAARDLVQELFSAVWSKREQIVPAAGLANYLHGAVRNRVLNFIEHRKIASRYAASFQAFADTYTPGPDAPLREKELSAIIAREIAALPPKMQEVFLLSRNGKMSHREIAELLNISEATVKNHIKAALRTLRSRLGLPLFLLLLISR
ncbi:MAG TPA: RNA polymerase sigma-70 factor [Chitinophaga sp.]